jgi:hypothetical protein
MGEDSTKFFHAMGIERYRRNCISTPRSKDGREIKEHSEMAGMLWACYKNRLGSSEPISMQFDLA